jgi:hypothetical protein
MARITIVDTFREEHTHALVDDAQVDFDAATCLHFTDAAGARWWYLARCISWFFVVDADASLNPFPERQP